MRARRLSILLVEEHVGLADAFRRVLLDEGHSVTVASSVADARDVSRERCFDLLLCDYPLPSFNALRVLEHARVRNPDVEGIVISAFGDRCRRDAARRAGFLAYLINPLTLELLRVITRHLSKRCNPGTGKFSES